MPTDLGTPPDTLLRLAHGCLESLAGDAGARVLHVKGVALPPELADGRPGSSDCDLLVHPEDVAAFVRTLEAGGWEQRTRFAQGSVFGHAATLYSAVWGTVDVHRTFPGLDADPVRTFETLWRDARRIELGSIPCAVPSLTHQRLILLVHAARDHMGRRDGDVRRAWTDATDAERHAVDAVARDLGAVVPLALVTGRPELARGGRDEHLWRAMLHDADPTAIWWARLRDARTPREAARVVLAGLRVNEDHLGIRLGRPPTAREVRRDWWCRWGRWLGRTWRLLRRR